MKEIKLNYKKKQIQISSQQIHCANSNSTLQPLQIVSRMFTAPMR